MLYRNPHSILNQAWSASPVGFANQYSRRAFSVKPLSPLSVFGMKKARHTTLSVSGGSERLGWATHRVPNRLPPSPWHGREEGDIHGAGGRAKKADRHRERSADMD